MKKLIALASGFTLAMASAAGLAAYPEKPIRLVVPFSPGGNIDLTARLMSKALTAELGQPVVVENKPGASGLIGAELVAKSEPDGYTLLLASSGSLSAAPALFPKMSLNAARDLKASRAQTNVPLVLAVNPKLEVKSVADLIAYAKAHPGKLTMASTGVGTSNHLAGELFQRVSGTTFTHVPYKGSSQALNDIVGGQVDLMFDNIPSSLGFIKSGTLRGLAVTSDKRSDSLPDLPTMAQAGVPDYEASTTTGIAMPAATPDNVAQTLDRAMAKALESAELKQSFLQMGATPINLSPAGFTQVLQSENVKWTKIISDANIVPN